jgi:hypothetical protein
MKGKEKKKLPLEKSNSPAPKGIDLIQSHFWES